MPELNFEISFHAKHNKLRANLSTKNAFIIEGGGTKGIYAIGVLKYLYEKNPYVNLSNVDIFGGTSVGSYLAAALSLGFDQKDMTELSKNLDISSLIDNKYLFMVTFYRFITKGYLYNDIGRCQIINKILDHKISIISQHLGEKINGKDLTFGHLNVLISKYPSIYKHLLINAVDISTNNQIFMTTLDNKSDTIKISDAMMASSAIPFIFKSTILCQDPETKIYTYAKSSNYTINHLIDGGVSTNNTSDFFLINDKIYHDYNLWLLKFSQHPTYVSIGSTISLLKQLAEYLISGKNDIKMDIVQDNYRISTINLHSNAGTLQIYDQEEIQQIINDIYQKCLSGNLHFGN